MPDPPGPPRTPPREWPTPGEPNPYPRKVCEKVPLAVVSSVQILTGGESYVRVPVVRAAKHSADVRIDLRSVEDPEGKGSHAIGKAVCPRDRQPPVYTYIDGAWYSQASRHDGRHFQLKANVMATREWREVMKQAYRDLAEHITELYRKRGSSKPLKIYIYCRKGRHRAVATGRMLERMLSREFVAQISVEDLTTGPASASTARAMRARARTRWCSRRPPAGGSFGLRLGRSVPLLRG